MAGVPGQVVEAVHLADGGQAAAHRGGRVAFGEDGAGCRRARTGSEINGFAQG